ncbi:lasso peptide biosynthesis B2 protein [Sphingobium xenophagum]|uniref:lasso peptide biosynthesis B2 protein n=1 Tax=Sphingobium xenophagum TaxID=121428 RepID=UPI000367F14E|nr:lasso peptide biosynthesis B2 protein [Sphingobium xenophagum]
MRPALDIRPGLHFCRFDGEYVLLDLPADRYFLVEGDIAQAFARFLNRCSNAADRAVLLEQKLICPSRTAGTGGIAMPPTATASLIDRPLPKARLLDTLSAILHQRRAGTDLRRQSFAEIASLFGEASCKNSTGNGQPQCLRAAAAFQRARRYVSATDQCLARGIGLRRMLAGHGCEARLVFGVTLPFAAHCWVQIGETVLSDPLDVVLHYKPIFAA